MRCFLDPSPAKQWGGKAEAELRPGWGLACGTSPTPTFAEAHVDLESELARLGPPLLTALVGEGGELANTSPHHVPIFRVLAQVIDDEAAPGDHLATVGADQGQRALDQF